MPPAGPWGSSLTFSPQLVAWFWFWYSVIAHPIGLLVGGPHLLLTAPGMSLQGHVPSSYLELVENLPQVRTYFFASVDSAVYHSSLSRWYMHCMVSSYLVVLVTTVLQGGPFFSVIRKDAAFKSLLVDTLVSLFALSSTL